MIDETMEELSPDDLLEETRINPSNAHDGIVPLEEDNDSPAATIAPEGNHPTTDTSIDASEAYYENNA